MKKKLRDYWIYHEELQIHKAFVRFVEGDLLPKTGIPERVFWAGLRRLADKFSKKNQAILSKRKELQNKLSDRNPQLLN